MLTAAIVIVLVIGLMVGLLFTLRSSARTGLPPADVLARAKRRARELEARERSEGADD